MLDLEIPIAALVTSFNRDFRFVGKKQCEKIIR